MSARTFEQLREEVKHRLREKLARERERRKSVAPQPRYDDVFFEGVAWLDEL